MILQCELWFRNDISSKRIILEYKFLSGNDNYDLKIMID